MTSKVRGTIIEHSVAVEQMITNQISLLLGIDKTKSIVFGTGNRAMPFNLKIELLTELSFYSKTQKLKLIRFSEIRNKFAHLAEIETFSDCFKSIDGLIKNMITWYPKVADATYSNDEAKYEALYKTLFLEIGEQVERFVKYYNDNLRVKMELEVKKQYFDLLVDEIYNVQKEYKDVPIIEEFVDKILTRSKEKYDIIQLEENGNKAK